MWGLVETVLGRMRDVGWLQTLASVIGLALATVGIGLWAALGTYVTKP